MENNFKFDNGETVRVAASAPSPLTPGVLAEVVGMVAVEQPRVLVGILRPRGTLAYEIEFGDGRSLEVTEDCIEPINRRPGLET